MATFSRLSTRLSESPSTFREAEHSYKYEYIPVGFPWLIFSPRCPRCRTKMMEQLIIRDTNSFTGTSEIMSWCGEVCRRCDILCENVGDVN